MIASAALVPDQIRRALRMIAAINALAHFPQAGSAGTLLDSQRRDAEVCDPEIIEPRKTRNLLSRHAVASSAVPHLDGPRSRATQARAVSFDEILHTGCQLPPGCGGLTRGENRGSPY
jgi:hypothetical protein